MTARLDKLAKGLGIGVDVLEHFVAGRAPCIEAAVERADICAAERPQPFGACPNQTFAVIIDDNRHVLARQPRLSLNRDPIRRHVGGEQGMAGGKRRLVPEIEQRDFLAQ